jgi:mannose-6-phosphate isomerase
LPRHLSPCLISGVLKDYAWGAVDGLVPWHAPTGGHQAELWFGAHPAGPSPLLEGHGATLADLAGGAPDLPLVKILAAARPLSLQLHPDAERAAAGFAAEQRNAAGPRLFADSAEKAEMLVALTDFSALAGWRPAQEAADLLAASGAQPELVRVVAQDTRAAAVRAILSMDADECERAITGLVAAFIDEHRPPTEVAAIARVVDAYPDDAGALVAVLLAHHHLSPGMAMAVPAGVVHSYVEGTAVEVMTSSDNVLRLGLTPKTIAIDAALDALRIDREPIVLPASGLLVPPGMPFVVQLLSGHHEVAVAGGGHRMVLCLEGDVRVDGIAVGVGRAAVAFAEHPAVEVTADGRAVIVRGGDQLPG